MSKDAYDREILRALQTTARCLQKLADSTEAEVMPVFTEKGQFGTDLYVTNLCPFCGSPSTYVEEMSEKGTKIGYVRCNSERCACRTPLFHLSDFDCSSSKTQLHAVMVWNRRFRGEHHD